MRQNTTTRPYGWDMWIGNLYMGVSKNRDTRKWMVYNGKPLLKWMIWGYGCFGKHPYMINICVQCLSWLSGSCIVCIVEGYTGWDCWRIHMLSPRAISSSQEKYMWQYSFWIYLTNKTCGRWRWKLLRTEEQLQCQRWVSRTSSFPQRGKGNIYRRWILYYHFILSKFSKRLQVPFIRCHWKIVYCSL